MRKTTLWIGIGAVLLLTVILLYGLTRRTEPSDTVIPDADTEALIESAKNAFATGSSLQTIRLADGKTTAAGAGVRVVGDTVTVTGGGFYRISGSLTDGQLCINAKKETVVLILDGIQVSNSSGPAILTEDAAQTLLYLAPDTENAVFSGASRELSAAGTDTDASGAAIYARDDLTVAGEGLLTVCGYINNGIATTDTLRIESGKLDILAVNNGLRGKDAVTVCGGEITVRSGNDGIKSNNDADGYGTIDISGGDIRIDSLGDGIQAANVLTVTGGRITVENSVEGLEAHRIHIRGGEIDITASDDGINANGGTSAFFRAPDTETQTDTELPLLQITGGRIHINAEGDGLDSNGNLWIEGGETVVDGPTGNMNGALDSGSENGGSLRINGGTVLAIGSSGMAETFEESSKQNSFALTLPGSAAAGTVITVKDADGNLLFTHTAEKKFASVIFSSPALSLGQTYTVTVGDTDYTVSQDRVCAGSRSSGFGGSGGMGGGRGQRITPGGEMPERGNREDMPDFKGFEGMPDFRDFEDAPGFGQGQWQDKREKPNGEMPTREDRTPKEVPAA